MKCPLCGDEMTLVPNILRQRLIGKQYACNLDDEILDQEDLELSYL